MSGGASRSWLEDAAARARFAALVEGEASDADRSTRCDGVVAQAPPRRRASRFSRFRAWTFPMVIVVGFAAMHAARVVPRGAGAVAEESSARSSAMQSKTKSGRMSVAKSVAAGTVAVAALSCAGGAMADAVEWRVADDGAPLMQGTTTFRATQRWGARSHIPFCHHKGDGWATVFRTGGRGAWVVADGTNPG